MYPKLNIDKQKLAENVRFIKSESDKYGVDICCVTKCFCAIPEIVDIYFENGIREFADSRIQNLKKINYVGVKRWLLRLPMLSEVEDVVKYSDISLNSQVKTVQALGEEASKIGVVHNVVMMVDLGDLREGVRPEKAIETAKAFNSVDGIKLLGVGVNLNCYGGVLPTETNINELVQIAEEIEKECGITLEVISGGNSGSIYLMQEGKLNKRVNNLRLGEVVFVGQETSYQKNIEGMHENIFTLELEVIEIEDKPSVHIGETGLNSFGEVAVYEDKGIMKRAIVGCGRQDVDISMIEPLDKNIEIIGFSSDHIILDFTKKGESFIGEKIKFNVSYGAILSLCTSEYVCKEVR